MATGNFVSLMGARYMESESDKIIAWAPLSLLPPGLLVSSRRKPSFNSSTEAKGKGKAKANEEEEDSGDDSESENEGLELDEWVEDKGDTSTDFLTAGESESAAGASHDGSAIVEKPVGTKGRGPAGTWLGFLDLTDSGTGELGEYGRITMRGDRKKRKFDEVIDLTTRGERKKQIFDEVIDLTGSDD